MVNAAAINAVLFWSIVMMSVVFLIGAAAVVWGFVDLARERRHSLVVQVPVVPAQRVHGRHLVHH